MSRAIEINGIEFITTREAAKVANYSNDYISKLAREGRVKGMQLGRQWFVDPTSLQNFLEQKKIEKNLRSEELRRERMLERTAQEVKAAEAKKAESAAGTPSGIVTPATVAALQAFLILSAGFLAGGAFWLSNTLVAEYSRAPQHTAPATQVAQVPQRNGSAQEQTATMTTTLAPESTTAAMLFSSGGSPRKRASMCLSTLGRKWNGQYLSRSWGMVPHWRRYEGDAWWTRDWYSF